MTARAIILNEVFTGFPKEINFKLIEETLRPLKEGVEYLVEAEFLSVDPYMRAFSSELHVGKTMVGEQVGKIIESKHSKYPVGKYVVGEFGWRTHTIVSDKEPTGCLGLPRRILNDFGNLPRSLALGVLGMPGNTAYFGFLKVCQPKRGDTVVVSAAAGAVGSHVGQIAKIKKCRVVGITGSDLKGERLVQELGFDAYVNYKKEDFVEKLHEATPDKIDCYFDNVGGEISSKVMNWMNKFGRVAICGSISSYNDDGNLKKVSEIQTTVKINHLRVEGFHSARWLKQWSEGMQKNQQWINEGKLKYYETVTEGFENMPQAFIGMLQGDNFGKAIVKV